MRWKLDRGRAAVEGVTRPRPRLTHAIVLPLLLLLGLGVGCSPQEESAAVPDPPPDSEPVVTQTIRLAPLATRETFVGDTRPEEWTEELPLRARVRVKGLPAPVALFDSVFWDPRDTESLRALIARSGWVREKTVLEIGTGSGLLSLLCLYHGAASVVATDVNPNAAKNARYNAEQFKLADRFEVRLVSLDDMTAFSAFGPSERFDLIISNPPWEDAKPEKLIDYAYYDPGFVLLKSLLAELPKRLNPGGKLLLAYGAREAILHILRISDERGYSARVLDDRDPNDMPPVFVPGMLIEVIP